MTNDSQITKIRYLIYLNQEGKRRPFPKRMNASQYTSSRMTAKEKVSCMKIVICQLTQ